MGRLYAGRLPAEPRLMIADVDTTLFTNLADFSHSAFPNKFFHIAYTMVERHYDPTTPRLRGTGRLVLHSTRRGEGGREQKDKAFC